MARLTGPEIREFQQVLVEAFNRQDLKQLLLALDKHFDCIVPDGSTLPVAVLSIIQAAERADPRWTARLLQTAAEQRPAVPSLQQTVQKLLLRVADLKEPPCPYLGMVPFTADDARFFYGREKEIKEMLSCLYSQQRLLFVIGSSGSGKSSLIAAGLLPRLDPKSEKRSERFPAGYWLVRPPIHPGQHPMQALGDALDGDPADPGAAVTELLAANPPAQRLLLVIDQFEELFTQQVTVEDRRDLIAAIQALRKSKECALLIALRADFIGDLLNSALWPWEREQEVKVVPLRDDALRDAIVRPADEMGVTVEPALVEKLLADAEGRPGVLPMLQETLKQVWPDMTFDAYRDLGTDRRSGLVVAIATWADTVLVNLVDSDDPVFASLSREDRKNVVRRIFLRLIQSEDLFGENRRYTRRQQPEGDLRSVGDDPEAFSAVLDYLADNRLLTLSGGESGERRVEISHEALINGWPSLQSWMNERLGAEQTRRRLEAKATEWVRLGRGKGGLLDRVELFEVAAWLGNPDASDLGRSDELTALAKASRTALRAQRLRPWIITSVSIVALVLTVAVYREWVRSRAGTDLVVIDGGPAIIGAGDPAAGPNATLLPFRIEKYEVSNAQYRACVGYFGPLHLGPCSPPCVTTERYADEETWGDYPVVYITARQAHDYCTWLERRLPTAVEWERAARGANGRKWPWGDNAAPKEGYEFPTDAVPVGSQPETATLPDSEGKIIYHLAYNVAEWVVQVPTDCADASCSHQAWDEKSGVGRIGRAYDMPDEVVPHVAPTRPENPGIGFASTGFRCAADSLE